MSRSVIVTWKRERSTTIKNNSNKEILFFLLYILCCFFFYILNARNKYTYWYWEKVSGGNVTSICKKEEIKKFANNSSSRYRRETSDFKHVVTACNLMQLLCIREGRHARAFSARRVIICLRALNAENRILYGDCRVVPRSTKES